MNSYEAAQAELSRNVAEMTALARASETPEQRALSEWARTHGPRVPDPSALTESQREMLMLTQIRWLREVVDPAVDVADAERRDAMWLARSRAVLTP